MIWVFTNAGAAKLLSFASQWVLGWLLTQHDFGLYALAISGSAAANLLRNGGTQQILIQRGGEFAHLAPVVFRVALGFNLLACLLLTLAGPPLAALYHSPDLAWLVACIGLSIPLATPWLISNARLAIQRRFLAQSNILLLTQFLRQFAAVILALLGFGAASLVLPVILESLVFSAVGRWCAGAPPRPARPRTRTSHRGNRERRTKRREPVATDGPGRTPSAWEILASSRWIMLGALALAASSQGAYLVIGLFQDQAALGVYFFGLQLVMSVATLFIGVIEGLVFPILAPLSGERQRAVYLRVVRAIWFLALPGAILVAILAEPVIHGVWAGKWDAAIPIAQILALGMPAWLLTSLSRSLVEAQGLWRLRLVLLGLYGGGEMLVAGYAAARGGLVDLALWVGGYRVVFGLAQVFVASHLVGARPRLTLWAILPAAGVALAAAAAAGGYGGYAMDIANRLPAFLSGLARPLGEALAFATVFVALSLVFLRSTWAECFRLLFQQPAKQP